MQDISGCIDALQDVLDYMREDPEHDVKEDINAIINALGSISDELKEFCEAIDRLID